MISVVEKVIGKEIKELVKTPSEIMGPGITKGFASIRKSKYSDSKTNNNITNTPRNNRMVGTTIGGIPNIAPI